MKLKFLALGIIFLALLATASAASTIEITPDPVRDIISSSSSAKFNLVLSNTNIKPRTVTFSHSLTDWTVSFSKDSITVGDEPISIALEAKPPKDVKTGSHIVTIYAKSADKTLGEADIKINVDEHAAPIDVRFEFPDEIGPGESFTITGKLENKEIRGFTNMPFRLRSQLFEETITFTESFQPLETKDFSIDVSIKPYLEPRTYYIYVNADVDGGSVLLTDFSLKIKEQGTLGVEESVSESIFGESYIIKITNLGNAKLNDAYKTDLTGISQYFTFASPNPEVDRQDGVKICGWAVSLAPGESTVVKYSVNYAVPIAIIILIMIILIYLYIRYRGTVSITKSVRRSKTEKGEKTINIQLAIKNLRNATVRNVIVSDYVSLPLHIVSGGYKTLKPDIIKKEKRHAKLIWKFDTLAPKEERVLSYNIRSKLKVIGRLTLPVARVSVKSKDGEIETFSSNQLALYGKE